MTKTLEMRDRSRDGLLEITDTRQGDGILYVTVRELIGAGCWAGGMPVRRMRALARRTVERPTSARLVRAWTAEGSDHATFAVVASGNTGIGVTQ